MELPSLLGKSKIPYPQRHLLELEIGHDQALADADNPPVLSDFDLKELETIHSTRLFREMQKFGEVRNTIETVIGTAPLVLAATTISMGGNMIEFIREGGLGMFGIIGIGAFLLFRELKQIFRLLVIKDHSKENLRLDTPSVLLGCLAMMFFGIGWSVLGIYVSTDAVIRTNASNQILLIGIKESTTPIIVSAMISTVVICAHFATRRMMHIWSAPIAD